MTFHLYLNSLPFQLENQDLLPSSACLPCIKLLDEVRKLREKISATQSEFQLQIIADQQPVILPSTSKGEEVEEYITEEVTVEEEDDDDDDSGDGGHGLDDSEDEVGMDAESFIIEEPEESPPQEPPPPPSTATASSATTKSHLSIPETTTDPVRAGLEEEMHRMDLLICHLCKERLPTYPALNHHFQSVHDQTGYIFCCNQKFGPHTAHYHIKFHQKTHPNDLPKPLSLPVTRELKARATPVPRPKKNGTHECPECGKVMKSLYNLQLHLKTHVPMEERVKSHICDVCGKAFDNPRNLSQHLDTHKNNVSQQCPICHKYFFRVKRHIQKQHERVRKKEVCTICGQVTTRLAAHMKEIHTESDERYTCDICWKEFRKPKHLKKHYTIHLGIRLTCHFCPHQATNSGNLSVHMRAHHAAEYEEHKAKRNSEPRYKEI